ncbi:hypothetical protein Pth03_80210 [Planotetraspora thailandica]|uniref:Uncharacterized protein n=1 Tax=Planotetraspora thailandica TaxID=487172 RepID=A0A8J3Y2F2_9ACTN|nr:hypothetical protein [Planotetraspora thailandica]GII59632.1 hypothetical protein Pth03_80210 [Planotetraspora thailandica]
MRISAEDAAQSRLSSEYAGRWSIWRSDAGRWYATRMRRSLSRMDMDRGLIMTASAENAEELRALLVAQDRLGSHMMSS